MQNDPDLELVELSRKGDKNAFSQLVNRHYEMVYAVCFGVLHNREAARDKAQDVFMKVFKDFSKFSGNSKFKTWIYRVAMNASIDQTRRKKPQVSLDATDATSEDHKPMVLPDTSEGPRDKAAKGELKELMKQALDELGPDHRAVLLLREWQGLSYDEIAQELNLESGTVMSRIFYARKKLAEVLKKSNIGFVDAERDEYEQL